MKKILLILIAFIAPLTAIFAQIDLQYERYTNQDDPVAHRDYTSCSNGFGGITAVLPEFDTASPDLNMRFIVFDSNMNIKRKYLYKDTNGRKLVPMDIKYSNDGLQYYICGYVIDQSQNLNPWLLILDTSGTVSQSKYLGNNGIFTRILEFNDTTLICAGALGNSVAFNTNRSCFISVYNKSAVLRYQYAMSNSANSTYFDIINDIEKSDANLIIAGTYSIDCSSVNIESAVLFCSMNLFTGTVGWANSLAPSNNTTTPPPTPYTSPNILVDSNSIFISLQTTLNSSVIPPIIQDVVISEFSNNGILVQCKNLQSQSSLNCPQNSDLGWQLLQDMQLMPNGNIFAYGKFLRAKTNMPWSCEFDLTSNSVNNEHLYKTDFQIVNNDNFSYFRDTVLFCSTAKGLFPLTTMHNASKIDANNFLLITLDKFSIPSSPPSFQNYKTWFINFNNSQSITYQNINLTLNNGCPNWGSDTITWQPLMLNNNTNINLTFSSVPFSIYQGLDLDNCPPSNP